MSLEVLLIAGLSAICVVFVSIAIFLPKLDTEKRTSDRLNGIRRTSGGGASSQNLRNKVDDASKRRKNVQDTLREIEEKNASRTSKKASLNLRIGQAGLSMSKTTFILLSIVSAVVFGLGGFLSQVPLIAIAGLVFVGGLGLPRFILNFLMKRRIKAFTDELPDAIDVIVRGIKAGLPLNDGLRLVANEAKEPLASEFRAVVEAQQLGLPMAEAIQKIHENIPTPETNFFAIVIAIQQSSGGSLSEALSNLGKILRDRKQMRAKVKAISSEAKASAGIIGSLPIFVGGVVWILSPDYINLLFTTSSGQIAVACGALLMFTGVMVMRKMINFQI